MEGNTDISLNNNNNNNNNNNVGVGVEHSVASNEKRTDGTQRVKEKKKKKVTPVGSLNKESTVSVGPLKDNGVIGATDGRTISKEKETRSGNGTANRQEKNINKVITFDEVNFTKPNKSESPIAVGGRTTNSVEHQIKKWKSYAKAEKKSFEKLLIEKWSLIDGRLFEVQRDDKMLVVGYPTGSKLSFKLKPETIKLTTDELLSDVELFSDMSAYVTEAKDNSEWSKITARFREAGLVLRLAENNGRFEARLNGHVFFSDTIWDNFVSHLRTVNLSSEGIKTIKKKFESVQGKRIAIILTTLGHTEFTKWTIEKIGLIYNFSVKDHHIPLTHESLMYHDKTLEADAIKTKKSFIKYLDDDSFYKSFMNLVKPGFFNNSVNIPNLQVFEIANPKMPDPVNSEMKRMAVDSNQQKILILVSKFPKESHASSWVHPPRANEKVYRGLIKVAGQNIFGAMMDKEATLSDAMKIFYDGAMAAGVYDTLLNLLVSEVSKHGSNASLSREKREQRVEKLQKEKEPSLNPRAKSDIVKTVRALRDTCHTLAEFYRKAHDIYDPDDELQAGKIVLGGKQYWTYQVGYWHDAQKFEMRRRGIDPAVFSIIYFGKFPDLARKAKSIRADMPTIQNMAYENKHQIFYDVECRDIGNGLWRCRLHVKLTGFRSPDWDGSYQNGGRLVKAGSEKSARVEFEKGFYPFLPDGNTTKEFDAIQKAFSDASENIETRRLAASAEQSKDARENNKKKKQTRVGNVDQDDERYNKSYGKKHYTDDELRGENGRRISYEEGRDKQRFIKEQKVVKDQDAKQYKKMTEFGHEDPKDYAHTKKGGKEYFGRNELISNRNEEWEVMDQILHDDYGSNPHQ